MGNGKPRSLLMMVRNFCGDGLILTKLQWNQGKVSLGNLPNFLPTHCQLFGFQPGRLPLSQGSIPFGKEFQLLIVFIPKWTEYKFQNIRIWCKWFSIQSYTFLHSIHIGFRPPGENALLAGSTWFAAPLCQETGMQYSGDMEILAWIWVWSHII